jgi:hypothetical protein
MQLLHTFGAALVVIATQSIAIAGDGFQRLALTFDLADARDRYSTDSTLEFQTAKAIADSATINAPYRGIPWTFEAGTPVPGDFRLSLQLHFDKQTASYRPPWRLDWAVTDPVGAAPLRGTLVLLQSRDTIPTAKQLPNLAAQAFARDEVFKNLETLRGTIPVCESLVAPNGMDVHQSLLLVRNDRFNPFIRSSFEIRCPVEGALGGFLAATPQAQNYLNPEDYIVVVHSGTPVIGSRNSRCKAFLTQFAFLPSASLPFSPGLQGGGP